MWCVYYELEGYADPTVEHIVSDLRYLARKAFAQPSYLRAGNRPVVFVWADSGDAGGMAQRWDTAKKRLGGDVYVVLKVYPGFQTDPHQPDSWHQYSPAYGATAVEGFSSAVSPGFWKPGEAPRLSRDLTRFESDVRRMVRSRAQWQLITTWNEWTEGTAVEPAREFGSAYVDILCRNLPGPEPCPAERHRGRGR